MFLAIPVPPDVTMQAIGTLAAKPPQANDVISGLLVAKDYSYTLLDPRDLRDFAGLSTCSVTQRQKVVLGVRWDLVRWHLEGMYGKVEEGLDKDGVPTMRVCSVGSPWVENELNTLLAGHGSCGRETHPGTRAHPRMGLECKQ